MKKKPAPSLSARLSAAQGQHSSALSIFEKAAADLDASSAALDAVADDATAEIARLTEIRDAALVDADKADTAASNVRALLA